MIRPLEKNVKMFSLKELSHGILTYFGHVQNYLQIEGNLEIVVY